MPIANQDATVFRMAADLRRLGATGNERDAIRALFALPYGWGEIVAMVDLALLKARASSSCDASA